MGWASGSELAENIWSAVERYLPEKEKQAVAFEIYNLFCDYDADDWSGDSDLEKAAEVNQEDEEEQYE